VLLQHMFLAGRWQAVVLLCVCALGLSCCFPLAPTWLHGHSKYFYPCKPVAGLPPLLTSLQTSCR
jgi:hypothetical protein